MNDQNHNPADTFRADQEAAQSEAATRDQIVWEQNVANARAGTDHIAAETELLRSKAHAIRVTALTLQAALIVRSLGGFRGVRR